jgi:hypothetical protein
MQEPNYGIFEACRYLPDVILGGGTSNVHT